MRVPIFIVAAIILIVFAIIGSAAANGLCFGVQAIIWFEASFLAFLAHLVFGGWGYSNGAWGRNQQGPPVV
jgi:hypothetical protein